MFMQEMIDMSKQQASQPESPPKLVTFDVGGSSKQLQAGPAQFGTDLSGGKKVSGKVVLAQHIRACGGSLQNGEAMVGKIVVVERGDCMFVEKARVVQSLGAVGGIVLDTTEGTAAATSPLFAMSGDGVDDIRIPMVFLFMEEAKKLLEFLKLESGLEVTLEEKPADVESDFAAALPEDLAEDQEQEDLAATKLKSAVHAFLDKNGKQEGDDDGNSLVIEKDNVTGEIVSQKIHTIRSPDGSVRTIKTVEQLKNGVGSVKVLKIEEMLEVQDVDDEIFGDLQDDQKTLSEEHENSEETSILSGEEEESESEYRERTGQEP